MSVSKTLLTTLLCSAFQQAFIVFTLFCSIAVACGFDWTFGFLWLRGETGLEWMQDLVSRQQS